MTRNGQDNKKLSKHLLEMKFMKSSRDRIREEEDEESCRALFYGQISNALKSSSKYIIEPSWVVCEGLKSGRRSYRGMNPTIEKIMEMDNLDKKTVCKVKEEDVDVTAEEMASVYRQESILVETTAKTLKRSSSVSPPPFIKKKFLKPADD